VYETVAVILYYFTIVLYDRLKKENFTVII